MKDVKDRLYKNKDIYLLSKFIHLIKKNHLV